MYRILCYGDSNTWGFNSVDGSRFPEDVRWTGVLQRLLGADYRVIEEGQCGRTTVWEDPIEEHRNGKTALYPTLSCQSPLDMVILFLGTNDLKPRFSLNAFDIAAGAERLVSIIQTYRPNGQKKAPKVLLVCPPPIGETIDESGMAGMFTAAHSLTVSRDLPRTFRNIAQWYDCLYFEAGPHAELSPDQVHFTPKGHKMLAQALAGVIQDYFANQK